jgi:hypothetical protein
VNDAASDASPIPGVSYPAAHPVVQQFLRQEAERAERRRAHLREHRPELFVTLDLVEVVATPGSSAAQLLRDHIVPGTVLVAHHDADDGTCRVDFEGGIHTRRDGQPPTPAERTEYAKIAAGRAAESYPTVARMHRIPRSDLRVIGTINPGEGTLTWHPGA